jgi:hypothetical protein
MRIGNFNIVKGSVSKSGNWLMIFGLLVALAACGRSDTPPAGILTKPQMVKIMSEILIAEEKVNRLGLNRDSAETVAAIFDDKIYQKEGASDSIFNKSFNYYMDHPAELELIYAALVDSLQLQEEKAPSRLR